MDQQSNKCSVDPHEIRQVYLVHLQVGTMSVTVYTSEEFAE